MEHALVKRGKRLWRARSLAGVLLVAIFCLSVQFHLEKQKSDQEFSAAGIYGSIAKAHKDYRSHQGKPRPLLFIATSRDWALSFYAYPVGIAPRTNLFDLLSVDSRITRAPPISFHQSYFYL